MRIPIGEIKVRPGRREPSSQKVTELAESMAEVGLLSPVVVDRSNTLIAGLCRLKAAKKLEWVEIECVVTELDGLRAELAEIEDNLIRREISLLEYAQLFSRRQDIRDVLHQEAARSVADHPVWLEE